MTDRGIGTTIALVAALAAGGLALRVHAQPPQGAAREPVSYPVLMAFIANGVPEPRIRIIVTQRGCVAPLNADQVAGVRALGVTESLLSALIARCGTVTAPTPAAGAVQQPPALQSLLGSDQFVRIEAGTFRMGSELGTNPPYHPRRPQVRTARLTQPFLIQKTEVTQAQWLAVMGSNPSLFKACGSVCPVESVQWADVQAFLDRLNTMDPGKGYRLPTEAEWEYAARAGATGEYGGTGQPDEMGWHEGNAGGRVHPVARKRPNAWGLYDMHGNVWEWVQDWYRDAYDTTLVEDPMGPSDGLQHTLRGGSWYSPARQARSASRSPFDLTFRNGIYGLRLVRSP